jgi:uncharacterized lipoprotein YmbA
MRSPLWLFPGLVLILVASCTGPPTPRIYVLGDPADPAPVVEVLPGRSVIRLLPVSIPDYLDTRDILFRSGRNEVKASPTGRWAERLSTGVTHALVAALTTRLPGADVVAEQPATSAAQQIMVDVQAFEIGPDRQCLLIAQWTLSDGDRILRRERNSFVEQPTDTSDAAVAAAMSRIIDRLASQIAAATPGQDRANAESGRLSGLRSSPRYSSLGDRGASEDR